MKIRISSNSIRFRIGMHELERLQLDGSIVCETPMPQSDGNVPVFHSTICTAPALDESEINAGEGGITCRLCPADVTKLADPAEEGVYVKRVHEDATGKRYGFVFYIEKDLKHSKEKKKHKEKHKHKDKHKNKLKPGAEPPEPSAEAADALPRVEERSPITADGGSI